MICQTLKPIRVQLSRKKGWRIPANTVKVCRPTVWGNPFGPEQIGVCFLPPTEHLGQYMANIVQLLTKPSLERCIDLYVAWLKAQCDFNPDFLGPLRGKNLACWCPIGKPCHADVLLDLANRMPARNPTYPRNLH